MQKLKAVLRDNVDGLCVSRYGRRSIRALARDAGIGQGTAQRIFEGETAVGLDVLERLASVFGVDPAALLKPALGVAGLSPMAESLGRALDEIEDLSERRTVWALCLLVVDQRALPDPTSSFGTQPTARPVPGRR